MPRPEKDGVETIVERRRKTPNVAIVAISGGGRARMTDYLDFSKAIGATAVLATPFAREPLLVVARKALPRRAPAGN